MVGEKYGLVLWRKDSPMPDTPPRMDRELLARVEIEHTGAGERVRVLKVAGIRVFVDEDEYEAADRFNAAASAWLDREVQERLDAYAASTEKEMEEAWVSLFELNAPISAPTENPRFNRLLDLPETIRATVNKAVDAETERCCQSVCMQCRSGAGVELIGGYWVHRAEECDDDMPCSAAAIRSTPGTT